MRGLLGAVDGVLAMGVSLRARPTPSGALIAPPWSAQLRDDAATGGRGT